MYGKSRRILFFLGFCFTASLATCIALIAKIMSLEEGESLLGLVYPSSDTYSFSATSDPTSGLLPIRFCVPLDLPNYYALFWVPLLSFEVIMFALAFYKGYGYFKHYKIDGSSRNLTMLLFRDSVAYFVMYVSCPPEFENHLMSLPSVFAGFLMNELVWEIGGVR